MMVLRASSHQRGAALLAFSASGLRISLSAFLLRGTWELVVAQPAMQSPTANKIAILGSRLHNFSAASLARVRNKLFSDGGDG